MEKKVSATPTLEEQADKIYDKLGFSEIKKLVTKGRKGWTHSKKETINLDTLTDLEIQKCNDDPTLAKLLIIKEVLESKIRERIDEITTAARKNIPYTVTDKKGIRVDLKLYDLVLLRKCCDSNRLELEQDLYNCIGYIRPMAKAKTAKGMLIEIEKVLKTSLKTNQNEGANTAG